tara:strand:- start:261 stop:482 length:222 start_codon:yes stop_codon:yes gene_type:complete
MPVNIGSADRIARIIVGLALILVPFVSGLALFANPVLQWGAVLVGAVLIVTALVRFCPLYAIFGLSTCKVFPR